MTNYANKNLAVGQNFQGGIIASISTPDMKGQVTGLIVAPNDQIQNVGAGLIYGEYLKNIPYSIGGFTDWRIPSSSDFNIIKSNIEMFNFNVNVNSDYFITDGLNSVGADGNAVPFKFDLLNGAIQTCQLDYSLCIRLVRTFTIETLVNYSGNNRTINLLGELPDNNKIGYLTTDYNGGTVNLVSLGAVQNPHNQKWDIELIDESKNLYTIKVGLGSDPYKYADQDLYLSCSDDGQTVDTWGNVSDRQNWKILQVEGHSDVYYIIVSGGVSGGTYLTSSTDGKLSLQPLASDNKLQQWKINKAE